MYLKINRFGHPIVVGKRGASFKVARSWPKLVSLMSAYGGDRDQALRRAYGEAVA